MFFESALPNGLRIIGQKLPHYQSISLGVWIGTGSVKERDNEAGISHFIEHMLFKGTRRRSAQQIAAEMDGMGAQLNAFTSKECTCYYAKFMGSRLRQAADVLSDMVLHSAFDPEEMKKEKGVVTEEILMVEDSPEDLAMDLLSETFFGKSPLGSPILGTKETVQSFTREGILNYMARHYEPANMLVAVAGDFDEQEITDCVNELFGSSSQPFPVENYPAPPAPSGKRISLREKDIEQTHVTLATPAFSAEDPRFYPLLVLNNALGGTMSSRLFQKIREERGLAYSVYSFASSYRDTGTLGFYAGTNAGQARTVLDLMLQEMEDVRKNGLSDLEFSRSKDQLKGSYILGNESTGARMSAIGKNKLLYGRVRSEEEIVRSIEAVTQDDIMEIAQTVLSTENMCGALVGKVKGFESDVNKLW